MYSNVILRRIIQSFLVILFLHILNTNGSVELNEDEEYLDIGVRLTDENSDQLIADLIAQERNILSAGHIPSVGLYHFQVRRKRSRRSKREINQIVDELQRDERIEYITVGEQLERQKRDSFSDDKLIDLYRKLQKKKQKIRGSHTYQFVDSRSYKLAFDDVMYKKQWYLENEGQFQSPANFDINVASVWLAGYSGSGVSICIVDDGIDHRHPDLIDHYRPDLSYDLNDLSDPYHDPLPGTFDGQNSHGTQCAGTAAAKANNAVCGVGTAFNAFIAGIRVLDGPITTLLEARAITLFDIETDIKSASWGPTDDGTKMEAPHTLANAALDYGIKQGRNGKGTLFVWAAGNGGASDDDCGADGYVSHHNVISISSINHLGETPYFAEKCPSTLAVVYTGGKHSFSSTEARFPVGVIASDVQGGCTTSFAGTSSAAPMAAGAFALVLEANPDLTYRDVMHIVTETARIPSVLQDDDWFINGAGHHVSDTFGFGVLDVAQMVTLAQNWTNVPPRSECYQEYNNDSVKIPVGGKVQIPMNVTACPNLTKMEHVVANISFAYYRRGNIKITIISPDGTPSELLSYRKNDLSNKGIQFFPFMTTHSWNEHPVGEWILQIETLQEEIESVHVEEGKIEHFGLRIFGSHDGENDKEGKRWEKRAFKPSKRDIELIYNREFAARSSSNLMQKRDHQNLMKQKRVETQTTAPDTTDKKDDKSPVAAIKKVISYVLIGVKYAREAIPYVRIVYDKIRDFFSSNKN